MSQKKAKAERKAQMLKGWRISVKPYKVDSPVRDNQGNLQRDVKGGVLMEKIDFDCRGSLASMLMNPELRLSLDEAFSAKDLADKIRACDGHVLLDSTEMQRVRAAYAIIKGPREHELEFYRRIKDAEEVELSEAKGADSEDKK